MSSKPILMFTIIRRRLLLNELCFYTNENQANEMSYSLANTFPEFYGFEYALKAIDRVHTILSTTANILDTQKIKSLMSQSLITYIYQSIDNVQPFLRFGASIGMSYLKAESLFLSFNGANSVDRINNYMNETDAMSNALKIECLMADTDSVAIITQQLNYFIYFIVGCCVFMILLFILYYNPYINSEQKTLKRLVKVLGFLPLNAKFLEAQK